MAQILGDLVMQILGEPVAGRILGEQPATEKALQRAVVVAYGANFWQKKHGGRATILGAALCPNSSGAAGNKEENWDSLWGDDAEVAGGGQEAPKSIFSSKEIREKQAAKKKDNNSSGGAAAASAVEAGSAQASSASAAATAEASTAAPASAVAGQSQASDSAKDAPNDEPWPDFDDDGELKVNDGDKKEQASPKKKGRAKAKAKAEVPVEEVKSKAKKEKIVCFIPGQDSKEAKKGRPKKVKEPLDDKTKDEAAVK